MLSDREIFDKVKTHLLTQGRRAEAAVNGELRCMYRGEGGTKCAAGCLVSDEAYTPELENQLSSSDAVCTALKKSGINAGYGGGESEYRTLRLIRRLQDIHDTESVEYWAAALDAVEEQYFGTSP